MFTEKTPPPRRGVLAHAWPWLVLMLMTVPAIWHVIDFPDDIDGEYPRVARPTFSLRPPSSYRLAEPGDTIDRVALYASAAIFTVAAMGWIVSRRARLWPAALTLAAACGWFAVTPSPCYDGWHGLGWGAIADPAAPGWLRITLAMAAISLTVIGLGSLWSYRDRWHVARQRGASGLLIVAAILIASRAVDIPGIEPIGYWPRFAFDWGLVAFGLALIRLLPPWTGRPGARLTLGLGGAVACAGLILGGIQVVRLHRPLERLHAVVPGKIYISAMPTYRGLTIEQERLHFTTIINLFPEETAQRSPRLPEELRFAREHGIKYVGSPGTALESDTFLDETLALAQDPAAWPILVHCHGCMDRSPAWMGIYRFVVQGRPLIEIFREIEAHRGVRPKASVTLLYNRVLPPRAPSHYAGDPTARILKDAAHGTVDPYEQSLRNRVAGPNPKSPHGVPRR